MRQRGLASRRGAARLTAAAAHLDKVSSLSDGSTSSLTAKIKEGIQKKKLGRPKKERNTPTPTPAPAEISPTTPEISDDDAPNPGHVDKNITYYCTQENDTAVKIASSIGCESWLDVAYIPENLERFPALQDKKVKFRKGTLVRIAEAGFVAKKAAQLVE